MFGKEQCRSVDVHVQMDLPTTLADTLERVQEHEPEVLQKLFTYGMMRRKIFDTLRESELLRSRDRSW